MHFPVIVITEKAEEAVVNELSVFRGVRPLQHLVTSIPLITEQRMTDVFHVGTDLVSPSRFQSQSHMGVAAVLLYDAEMSDRIP